MIEIKIPKEIKDYKGKWFFGLTLRRTISLIISVGIGISSYHTLLNYIPPNIASYLMMISVTPTLFLGFFTYNGLTAEQFLLAIIKTYIRPRRMYEEDNIYTTIREEIIEDEDNKKNRKRGGKIFGN